MHRNPLWLGFLLVIFAITVFQSCTTVYSLYRYLRWNHASPVTIKNWEVLPQEEDLYYVQVHFRVEPDGPERAELWEEWHFVNPWAAEAAIQEWQGQEWKAWHPAARPDLATLRRELPWKSLIYTLILIGILCYFIGLGYYVGQRLR